MFNANSANAATLLTTVAGTMTGITASMLSDLTITDVPTAAPNVTTSTTTSTTTFSSTSLATTVVQKIASLVGLHQRADGLLMAATTAAITATFTMKTTSIYTSEQLFDELVRAVQSGSFNSDLYANSQSAGAKDLLGCTSFQLTALDLTDDTPSDHQTLSDGGIFGVVVGVMFLVGMFIGAIYVLVKW